MKFRSLTQGKCVALVGTILFFAVAFVIGMVLHGLTDLPWGNWRAMLNIVLLFGVLGAFYGAIVALDRESGMSEQDRPFLRFSLCGALGATAVLLVQAWPPQTFDSFGAVVGLLIGGALGWLGWSWAKYVNF